MEIYDHILETLGNTPLVMLSRFAPDGACVAAKVEYFNPGSSVKDRIGPAMIEAGEKAGLLEPGGTIVEPTSGNTGLGLAMSAALKGYKMVCTAPDKIPKEKFALLKAFGVEVVLCPTEVPADDPDSYYKVAEQNPRRTRRLSTLPVLQPGQPRGALPHDRPRDLEADGRQSDPLGGGCRHRRDDQRHR